MATEKKVIIKKVVKGGHGGHHGGSWKIAYADFVTAMMAFFLLMWLLNNTSEETKKQLSTYFQEFSVLEGAPSSMGIVDTGADGTPEKQKDQTTLSEQQGVMFAEGIAQEETLREAMLKMIQDRLQAYKNEIMIDTFDNGVRIQMLYSEGHPFFESGSPNLTTDGQRVLHAIATTILNIPNKLAVEGHTDAKPLGGSDIRYTNWELSTDRASSARLKLEEFGVQPDRIVRVAGYAATQPLDRQNPENPRNRRVSILLFNEAPQPAAPRTPTTNKTDPLNVSPLSIDAPANDTTK